MKFLSLLTLALTLLMTAACVVEPLGGGHRGDDRGWHDDGHRVWSRG